MQDHPHHATARRALVLALLGLAACQDAATTPRSRSASAVSKDLAAPVSDTVALSDVTYGMLHGTIRIWNSAIASTAVGSISGDSAFVQHGSQVTLTGTWQIGAVTDVSYCPTCIVQEYLGWRPPGLPDGGTPTNLDLWTGIDSYVNPNPGGEYVCPNPDPGGSIPCSYGPRSPANFSWTVNAPTVDGTYYIGVSSTLDFQFDTRVAASLGYPTGGPTSQHAASFAIISDNTPPVVTYAGNAGTYTVDQDVAITCSAMDALSGVASTTCANISGPAYSFPLGSNTFSASATDRSGNVGTGSTTFTVGVTAQSVCALVQRWATQPGNGDGVAHSLCVKLEHGDIEAFQNELSAQTGNVIAADKAAILSGLANALAGG